MQLEDHSGERGAARTKYRNLCTGADCLNVGLVRGSSSMGLSSSERRDVRLPAWNPHSFGAAMPPRTPRAAESCVWGSLVLAPTL